ncbi:MAG: glycosyltransferase family 2 protein [Lachnospiraceae bacterium]|nr:glycosyltransferase family 2 protein [Lachnospiraceae bacterium]
MATVSVITPFYDGNDHMKAWQGSICDNENYLRKMNDEKKTSHSIEVILVNDSPGIDPVLTGINSGKKNWHTIANPKNIGIHGSRVHGLSKAKGEYVLFLDQDDILRYDALYAFLEEAKKHEGEDAVIISNALIDLGNEKQKLVRTASHRALMWDFDTYIRVGTQIISPGQCLIKRSLIPAFWKENLLKENGSDDFFLWLLMMKNGVAGVFFDEPLYHHIDTGSNISADSSATDRSCFEFLDLLSGKEIMSEKEISTLRKTLSVKSRFRKGNAFKKLLTSMAHPMVVGTNVIYKAKTKTGYGFGRTAPGK